MLFAQRLAALLVQIEAAAKMSLKCYSDELPMRRVTVKMFATPAVLRY